MESKWTRSTNVVWENLDGNTLLVDVSTGLRWTLNASASQIWRLCDGQHSLSEIASACAAGAGDALRGVRWDVAEICEALAKSGLLNDCDTPPSVAMLGCDVHMSRSGIEPTFKPLGLGANSRRRASPRGNSGPG